MITFLCASLALINQVSHSTTTPFELDSNRKPSIQTKGNCLINSARIYTITNGVIENGQILVKDGKIAKIGTGLTAPEGFTVIDASDKYVSPGIIDPHAHVAQSVANELNSSITIETNVRDAYDPDNVEIYRALAAGKTSALILHGSANSVGGQSMVVRYKYRHPFSEIIFPGSPEIVKFALGENPKRDNTNLEKLFSPNTSRFPATRMGVEAVYQRAFADAQNYLNDKAHSDNVRRDLRLEGLAKILTKDISVNCHAYTAAEMLMLIRLRDKYDFNLLKFDHATEAFKIAPELAKANIGITIFPLWGYKMEALDHTTYAATILTNAGVVTSLHSDSMSGASMLNQYAAQSLRYGGLDEESILKLITINPAKQIGISDRVGSIEVGKDADLAIWEGHPLSAYSRCVMTLIEGEVFFERHDAFGLDKQFKPVMDVKPARQGPVPEPAPAGKPAYAIVGGTVHTISGDVINGGTVLISGDKIVEVGKRVDIPKGAHVVNAKGLHVYPGLIDTGSTLGLSEISSVSETIDVSDLGQYQPDLSALTAVNPSSIHFGVARCHGITSTLIMPGIQESFFGEGNIIGGQAALIHTAGWTPDEMAIQKDFGLVLLFPIGPEPELEAPNAAYVKPKEREKREERYQKKIKEIEEYFDRAKRYAEARSQNPEMVRLDARMEAMIPYVTGQRPVIMHTSGPRAISEAIAFAEKLNLKIILSGAARVSYVMDLVAEKHIPLLLDTSYGDPRANFEPYDSTMATYALLTRAGIRYGTQSGAGAPGFDCVDRTAQGCSFGLSPEDAIRALTLDAAKNLGVDDKIGSLEKGKLADIIITDGDPVEYRTRVLYEFIAGKPIRLESHFTKLYEQYRNRK